MTSGDHDQTCNPSSRELFNDWLAALTIMGEHDMTAQQRCDLIAQVTQTHSIDVTLHSPLSRHDQKIVDETMGAIERLLSRQVGVHHLVEETLITWLCEATGQSRARIIQRLALELDESLAPKPDTTD